MTDITGQTARSPLQAFFDPTGVAIVGASADPQKIGHSVLRNAISYGYRGAVYPVNPRSQSILGLPCYQDMASVPDPVELAVIVLPAALCAGVLEACGRRGLKAAIVISGGFKEVGAEGLALEQELLAVVRQHGMRLIGPNCVGTMDAFTGLNTTFIRSMPRPGPIAFASQSGAICGGILEWAEGKGIGFSRFANLGNAADVSETDLIEAWAEDPNTRVIAAYVEAIRDGRRFVEVARRVTPHKPILVVKAGRTAAGTRAVSSHTGSLAGAMAAYDAAFQQSGVLRVGTVEELFANALALAYGPLPRGDRVAVVTNAGGPASLAADAIEEQGLRMPAPSAGTRARLAAANHPDAQLGNPIDMLGGADAPNFELAVQAVMADDSYDAVQAILVPQALLNPVAVAEAIGRAAGDAASRTKPVVACFMGDEAEREPVMALHQHRIACYLFPEQAARALGALWAYARRRAQARAAGVVAPAELCPVDAAEAGRWLAQASARGQAHLGEASARPIVEAYGIPQPRAELARTPEEASRAASRLGFPVALKVVSPDILHKSEVGGVALNLMDEGAVRRELEAMLARAREGRPGATIEGALVAQMAPPGIELIVGMRRDPQFGPLVAFGLGGIYVELFEDVAFRVAPFGRDEALAMIDETRAGRLLRGWRGQPAADVDAVAAVILQVAQLALDHPQIEEIDINPLIAYPAGSVPAVLAVDARLVLSVTRGYENVGA